MPRQPASASGRGSGGAGRSTADKVIAQFKREGHGVVAMSARSRVAAEEGEGKGETPPRVPRGDGKDDDDDAPGDAASNGSVDGDSSKSEEEDAVSDIVSTAGSAVDGRARAVMAGFSMYECTRARRAARPCGLCAAGAVTVCGCSTGGAAS